MGEELLTPSLAASLDRNKISDRAALMINVETLDHNITSLTLTRSSIRRRRQQHREDTALQIKINFFTDKALVVHWDGKLLKDLTGNDKVDRLPVLFTSLDGSSPLLAVPQITTGTGAEQAHAVFTVLQDWKIQDNIQGMWFDTTSYNTGRKIGVCVLIEQLLGERPITPSL